MTIVAQYWFGEKSKRRTLAFQEKKESFVGLLNAYHQAAITSSVENAKNFAYWKVRCEIIADDKISHAIQRMIDTNENMEERFIAHNHLKEVLRRDLQQYL